MSNADDDLPVPQGKVEPAAGFVFDWEQVLKAARIVTDGRLSGRPDDAEDEAQNSAEATFRNRDSVDNAQHYAAGTARRRSADFYRRQYRRDALEVPTDPSDLELVGKVYDLTPERIVEGRELVRALIELVDELDDEQKRAFAAAYFSGGTLREGVIAYAEDRGITTQAVYQRLQTIRRRLRESGEFDE